MAAAIPPKVSRIVDVFVSLAAAVVIIGALFKLEHWDGADGALIIGLGTEAVVFLIYGILYVSYPAIDDHQVNIAGATPEPKGNPALKSMEKMLAEADITPTTLSKLGEGFNKLGSTVKDLGQIGDAVAATNDYAKKTKEATVAISAVKDAYANTAASVGAFNDATETAKVFQTQMKTLTTNLSSLNSIYELELQAGDKNVKALNAFAERLNNAAGAMVNTVDDANKAKEQISSLAGNLSRLNQIYGNMISAMQGRQ